ncbi:hypothetical protein KIPB_010134 [Kipferlia bialata]|uniref:Uncharacterized protein n=1 Tax=Kipferlia bialata TaxID=797122 RepID=A0A9K3D612_9EUKA|nr:hypothetical protein KIPB_010134 [Kipferlia bialata]|eukprot:g10134.t1
MQQMRHKMRVDQAQRRQADIEMRDCTFTPSPASRRTTRTRPPPASPSRSALPLSTSFSTGSGANLIGRRERLAREREREREMATPEPIGRMDTFASPQSVRNTSYNPISGVASTRASRGETGGDPSSLGLGMSVGGGMDMLGMGGAPYSPLGLGGGVANLMPSRVGARSASLSQANASRDTPITQTQTQTQGGSGVGITADRDRLSRLDALLSSPPPLHDDTDADIASLSATVASMSALSPPAPLSLSVSSRGAEREREREGAMRGSALRGSGVHRSQAPVSVSDISQMSLEQIAEAESRLERECMM